MYVYVMDLLTKHLVNISGTKMTATQRMKTLCYRIQQHIKIFVFENLGLSFSSLKSKYESYLEFLKMIFDILVLKNWKLLFLIFHILKLIFLCNCVLEKTLLMKELF